MRQAASFLLWLPATITALTVAEINGDTFLSPYKGAAVTNVTGLVTAKGSFGVFIRSTTPDDNDSTSESILVYSSSVASSLKVGDIVTLDGTVSEYRSSDAYMYLTEITKPSNVKVVSSGNEVTPVVIGEDTPNPVTVQYTSLDEGDIFSLPNARSNISSKNPTLDPSKYGLDFWESLMGELVTIKSPRALSRPNTHGDTWVVSSDWETTGQNEHGGLTITDQDENPEAILIGSPLDSSANPDGTKMGDLLEDITGVMYQAFGFYRILPLTGLTIKTPSQANAGPTTLLSSGDCNEITIADYNVENLSPTSAHLPRVAAHIVNYLKTPDLVFVQEIQDNSGPTNNGIVSANETLLALTSAISSISNVSYSFVNIDPVNGQDGGQPGGNIRVAYLYNPETIKLAGGLAQGGSTDANEVIADAEGKPTLKYNPGRIDPTNAAWLNSRKPLAAAWVPVNGNTTFFTVNVHWASKGGSSSIHGDYRPPINGAVEQRMQMANVTGTFINSILALDSSARIIAAGDFNEFSVVEPILALEEATGMQDLDEVVGRDVVERYTYQFDMNTQALDHMLVSPALQTKKTALGYEHLHVNSWATANDVVSDHDPSVAKFNLCDC